MDRKRSRRMGGVTVLFAVVVVCVFGKTGFGQAEGAGDELLRAMPAETLFAVRVNKFDWTVGQLDQFLMGASPVPVGVSMIARMQIAGVLGDAELKNVDTNGSFAIFGLAAGEPGGGVEGVFIAGLLPVSNFEAFLKENASCSEPDENGISRITTADMTGGSRTMLTAKVGSFAMVTSGELYDGLVKVVKAVSAPGYAGLTGKLDEGQIEESVNEPVWAYVDMQEVQRRFGDVIKEELSEIQGMMAMAQSGGGQPMPAGLMEALGGLMEGFMSQTESISVTADPKPTVLNLRERIKAVDGTTMWDLCSAGPPLGERTELFGYLPDKTTMSMGCTIDKAGWKALNRCGIEFCRVMAGESLGSDDAEKMRQLADDLVDSFGERLVCSFVSEPPENPLVYTYVIEVADAEKLNAVIDAGPEVWNKIAGVFKDMGLEMSYSVERGSDSYKGVTIDSAFMSMTSTEPNTQQGQMMDAMYGGGFDYRWAIVNGLYVCVIGGDVDAGVRRLIDQVQAGGAKEIPAELEQAMGLLPDAGAAEAVGTYNLLRAMTIGFAMSPMPMPMPDIESKSNISFAAKGGDGTLSIDIAVPKEHLSEVVSAGMMMQQAMMQGQKQAAAAPKARAAAKPMPRVKIPSAGPVTEIGPNKGKLVIEPGVDIGGVRFGMTAEKMEEILGPAESRTGCAYYYFDSGFAVITASDGTVDVVLCGCLGNADSPLVKNCGYRTSGDVGMGCRRAKVIATYGEPTSVRKHGDGTGATTLEYDQMFCRFTVIDDKVVQMVFRRPR